MKDKYINLINKQWHHIAIIYNEFKDKKPIIEYLINSGKLLSYPAKDYINTLSDRTRDQTKKQYIDACKKNQFLLFVKDEKNQNHIFSIFHRNK